MPGHSERHASVLAMDAMRTAQIAERAARMETKRLTADEIAQIAVAEWMVGAISFEEAAQRIRNAEDET